MLVSLKTKFNRWRKCTDQGTSIWMHQTYLHQLQQLHIEPAATVTLQNTQKSDLTFWTWNVNSEVHHFGDHVRPPWRSGCYLTLVLKMCIFWNTHFLILKSNQSRDQNFHMRSNNLIAGLLSLSTSASAL